MANERERIPLLERNQAPPEIRAIYDALLERRGVVPNMFKLLAHTPGLAEGVAGFLKSLMGDGALPAWYKELVATRVALLQNCAYCISSHRYLAKLGGATDEQIAGVDDFETGPFSQREKIGFRAADRVHQSGEAIDGIFYAELESVFNRQEIIDLIATAAAFEYFTRFVTALRIPVTPLPAMPAAKE